MLMKIFHRFYYIQDPVKRNLARCACPYYEPLQRGHRIATLPISLSNEKQSCC